MIHMLLYDAEHDNACEDAVNGLLLAYHPFDYP